MKKLLFIIFLMVFSFATIANAKKPKVVWPKAVLTLKDGTVLNGYLQNDIHFMKKNIYFSETQNGKDVKYKIVDIKSLEVDNALQDGKKRTFILIDEDPTFQYLATVIYKGKHVTGYMQPFAFENSTHSRSFTGIWTNNTVYLGCRSYDYKVDGGKLVYYWMLFEDKKINSKREKYSQKKLLKKIKNLKSATYRVSWEFTCKTTKILLLYIFLGHNRNVVNTKFPYPIKRLEVIRRFNQKSIAFNQSLS